METIENIKQRAATVKDATQAGENTATRVGGVLVDLTDVVDKNNQATNAALDTKATKAELTEAKKTQAEKDSLQDAELAKKADSATMTTELAKKFDKSNIAQEFGDSEDKVVSQFALPFREIESPEFLKLIVDAEDHVLFGIQLDGSVEWGKGIPAPIRAKLQEIINKSQQDKTDILEALNTAKEELSASIAELQQNKVDKEEGKSLIDDEVKECFKVIENDEFIHAITDSEDRLLFGIYRETGKPYFPLNDMYHVEQNEEYFAVWLDAADHVLFGIRRDGILVGKFQTSAENRNTVKVEDFNSEDYPDFFQI